MLKPITVYDNIKTEASKTIPITVSEVVCSIPYKYHFDEKYL